MKKTLHIHPLYLSLGIIILVWLQELIRNIFYIDKTINLTKSLPKFFLYAFMMGMFYVLLVTLLLHLSREKYKDIGFHRQKLLRQFGNGVLFGVMIFILQSFIIGPIIDGLLPKTSMAGIDKGQFFNQLYYLPILLILTSFKGGFSEELWRIFVLTRFQKCWGKTGLVLALIVESMLFGLGHLYQGVGSMITVGIVGFLYSLVYLRKRLALEAVVAHATDDIISVLLGFILYHGQ